MAIIQNREHQNDQNMLLGSAINAASKISSEQRCRKYANNKYNQRQHRSYYIKSKNELEVLGDNMLSMSCYQFIKNFWDT